MTAAGSVRSWWNSVVDTNASLRCVRRAIDYRGFVLLSIDRDNYVFTFLTVPKT